jgi:hypothetical protein
MTNLVSDELLRLAEIGPMSAGTRVLLRRAALRVQALEREHSNLAHLGGSALGQLYTAAASHYHQNCATCTCRETV